MNIRFYNAKILKLGDHRKFTIEEGELWVKGDSICYIGDGTDIDKVFANPADAVILWDREIDVEGL